MRKYDLISSLVFLVGGVLILVGSLQLPIGKFSHPGPGQFPLITAILMCIFSGGMFIKSYLQFITSGREPLDTAKKVWHRKPVAIVVLMFLYAVTVDWLGFLTVTFVFLFIIFKTIADLSLRASFVGASVTAVMAYLLFRVWLNVQLPVGPLGV